MNREPIRLPKTKRGARKQYHSIINRARKCMAGGLTFGMDWPTFSNYFPAEYDHIQKMRMIYSTLPE